MGTLVVDKLLKTSTGAAEFILPATDGVAGSVWQSDGSGQLSVAKVAASNIVAATITNTEIASSTITGGNIAGATIEAGNIGNNQVTPLQLADQAFTANRNILINGDMQIAQRSASVASLSATTNTYQTVDRWMIGVASAGAWTMSQSATAADGFGKSLLWECTTASTSLAAGGFIKWGQFIEGYNVQQLKKGTAAALTVTLSFWIKAIVKDSGGTAVTPATFIAEFQDEDNTRTVSSAFTITAQDTWEYKTIIFPADTTGVLDNDSARSLAVRIAMAAGSNYTSGSLQTAWGALSNADRYVGCTNLAAHTDNKLWITGMQLEVGSYVTPYDHKTVQQELFACQRYYCKSFAQGVDPANANGVVNGAMLGKGVTTDTDEPFMSWQYPSVMRATPTITLYNHRSGGTAGQWDNHSNASSSNARVIFANDTNARIDNSDVKLAAANAWMIHATAISEI